MNIRHILSVLSGIVVLYGTYRYIVSIIREETKPKKATWLIWCILNFIVLFGMYSKGAVNGQIIGICLGVLIISVLSIKYGTSGWSKKDKACMVGAAIGLLLWALLRNPLFGIMISSAIGIFASIPTFVSAWEDPSREDKLSWTIFEVSCVLSILAIPKLELAYVVSPATFLFVNSVVVCLIYFHKGTQKECD